MSKEASSVEDTEARSAMKLALEALSLYETSHDGMVNDAMKALRQAIAEAEDNYQGSDAAKAAHMMDLYTALGVRWGEDPFAAIAKMRSIAKAEKQEPHSWYSAQEDEWMTDKTRKDHERLSSYTHKVGGFDLPLYTTPQQPSTIVRKPLTDEQIGDIAALYYPRWQGHEGFARAIEAAHGIKENA